jgi:hypothetical protein
VGIRQLDFPGWRAWLDGRPAPIEHAPNVPEQQAAPGFIVLSVPPGEHTVGLAFGPSPLRAIGGAVTLLAVAGLALGLATRRGIAPLGRGAALAAAILVAALVWRGARPALAPVALLPLPAAAQGPGGDGVWRAPDLEGRSDGGGLSGGGLNPRTGLLVNVAEAVRQDRAVVNSPSGSDRGPGRFVDVRQLVVADEDDPLRGASGTTGRQWLYLHPPSEVALDVALPAGRQTWLQGALALDPGVWRAPSGDGVRYLVAVAALDARGQPGLPATVFDRALNARAKTEERQWVPVEVDLSAWAGQTVRLTLRSEPREDLTHDWAGWGNPVLVVREQARAQPAAP